MNLLENPFVIILLFFAGLSFLIFIHELGHYWAARFFGVRVENFSIGFGKEIWGRTDKHSTRWSINVLPLGGFIKLFGDVDPKNPVLWDKKNNEVRNLSAEEHCVAYYRQSVWARMMIVAAGPMMNFTFFLGLLIILYATVGQPSTRPVVVGVGIETSAEKAGFEPGDIILAMDGQELERFEESWEKTRDKNYIGQLITFTLQRGDTVFDAIAAPTLYEYEDKDGIPRSHGRLGAVDFLFVKYEEITVIEDQRFENADLDAIRQALHTRLGDRIVLGIDTGSKELLFTVDLPAQHNQSMFDPNHRNYKQFYFRTPKEIFYLERTPLQAVQQSFIQFGKLFDKTAEFFGHLFTGYRGADDVKGLGSMGEAAEDSLRNGFLPYLFLLAFLSFQIGIINLLPIPMLDGGHLVFLSIEAIARKPVPMKLQEVISIAGLFLLAGLMVLGAVNDAFDFLL